MFVNIGGGKPGVILKKSNLEIIVTVRLERWKEYINIIFGDYQHKIIVTNNEAE